MHTGHIYYKNELFQESIIAYDSAAFYANEGKDPYLVHEIHLRLGQSYLMENKLGKALKLFDESEHVQDGGMSAADLEIAVQSLMSLMEPSYIEGKTEAAKFMRRLLYAGAIAIADASDGIGPEETLPLATKKTLYGFVNARYFWEFGAESTLEGNTFVLTLTFPIPSVPL